MPEVRQRFNRPVLGSIHLGEDVPAALSPLSRAELLLHDLGFSPDRNTRCCFDTVVHCAPFRLAIISTRRFVPGTDGRGLDLRPLSESASEVPKTLLPSVSQATSPALTGYRQRAGAAT